MRISDWSSDVCSSDLRFQQAARRRSADPRRPERLDRRDTVEILAGADPHGELRRPEQRVERVDVIGHQRMFIGLERRGDGVLCFWDVAPHGELAWLWTIPARSR